jgi:hypothetical protein
MGRPAKILALMVVGLFLISLVTTQPVKVKADSPKTIVVPDDYSNIQTAINQANDRDTVLIKKGNYEGPINQTLTIDKTICIIGESNKETIIRLHPSWSFQGWNYVNPVYDYDNSIEINANDVVVSNLTIISDGGSILAIGNRTQFSNNQMQVRLLINGFQQTVSKNILEKGVGCFGSNNTVKQNIITGAAEIGGNGKYNLFFNNTIENTYGILLVDYGAPYTSDGNEIFSNIVKNCSYGLNIRLSNSKSNLIYNNYLANNTVGIEVMEQGINTEIYTNKVSENEYGIKIDELNLEKENITLYHNNFIANKYQVSINTQTILRGLRFDSNREGNYWSDYNGTDANQDGVGDTPYIINDNYQDRYPLMQPIEIASLVSIKTNTGLNATIIITIAAAISILVVGIFNYLEKPSKNAKSINLNLD